MQTSGAFNNLVVQGPLTLAAGGDLTVQGGMVYLGETASFGDGASGAFTNGWLMGDVALGTDAALHFGDDFYLAGVDVTGAAGLTTFTDWVTVAGNVSIASAVDINDTPVINSYCQLILTGGGTVSGTVDIGSDGLFEFGGGEWYTVDGPTWFIGAGQGQMEDAGTTLDIQNPLTMGTFSITPGTAVDGPATWTVGQLTWTGGEQKGTGSTIITQCLLMSGEDGKSLSGRHLQVETGATAIQADGLLWMDDGAEVVVQSGATFSLQNNADIIGGINTLFTNFGRFEKLGGAGQSEVWVSFENRGTGTPTAEAGVFASSGELAFMGDGVSYEKFEATDANARISFLRFAKFTCYTGTTFCGPGWTLVDDSATLEVPNGEVALNEGRFELGGNGEIVGTGPDIGCGTLNNAPGALLNWTGGKLVDLYFANNGQVEISGGDIVHLQGSRFVNFNDVIWTDGDIAFSLSANLASYTSYILNYGTFDIQCDKAIVNQTGIYAPPGAVVQGGGPNGENITLWVGIDNLRHPYTGSTAVFSKLVFTGQQTIINVFFHNFGPGGVVTDPWDLIYFAGGYDPD